MLRELVDRAFLGPQVRGAAYDRQQVVYPNGGRGWHWESLIWSEDPDRDYLMKEAHAKNKIAPVNLRLDGVLGHREFRVKVAALAQIVWFTAGVLGILAR